MRSKIYLDFIPQIFTKNVVRDGTVMMNGKDMLDVFVGSSLVEETDIEWRSYSTLQRTCISVNIRCFDAFFIILGAPSSFHTTVS